jgi:hypothetical protein
MNLWSRSLGQMKTMIKVRTVKSIGDYRLTIEFSDETRGEHDFSFICKESGPMLEPLKDPAFFKRALLEMVLSPGPMATIGILSPCTTT